MSGKKTRARRFVLSFSAFCAGATILYALGVAALFLTNIGNTSPGDFASLFSDGAFLHSARLSLITATITTAIAAAIGIPASYALARWRVPLRPLVDALLLSPVVLPASSVGLFLLVLFQSAPVRAAQQFLGFDLVYTVAGIVPAQLILCLCFGMHAWTISFRSVDPRHEQVARSLGATPFRAFWKITLPAAKTGLLAGAVIAWTRAFAEFGAVLLFCGPERGKTDVLPIAAFLEISEGHVEKAIAICFAMSLVSFVALFAFERIVRMEKLR